MRTPLIKPPPRRNRLLASLPRAALARLVPQLEEISFEVRQVLYDQDKPIDYVYFPLTGVFSLVVVLQDGTMVEAATT